MKRILFILLLLASCAAIAFMLWKGPEPTAEQKNLLQFIPEDAYMMLEVPSAMMLDQRINGGLLIWEELQSFPAFQGTDSLIGQFSRALGPEPFLLSRHTSGAKKSDWLLTMEPEIPLQGMEQFFAKQGFTSAEMTSYNGEEFKSFSKGNKSYFLRITNKVVQCSLSKLLLEKASRVEAKGILKLPGVQRILKTKAASSLAYLYVDHESLPEWGKEYLTSGHNIHEAFGAWSLSDIEVETNALHAIGLIEVSDSAAHELAKYAPYRAVSLDTFLDYVPDNTVSFTMSGQSAPNRTEDSPLSVDREKGHLIGRLEGASNSFLLYPLRKGDAALELLRKDANKDSEFRGLDLYVGNASMFDSALLKEADLSTASRIAVIKDMAILAPDVNSLKELLDRILTNRTLEKDENFQSLLDDVSSNSSYQTYLNLARTENILQEMLLDEVKPLILQDIELLRKFQALIIQYEPSGAGLFHMNMLLKYNPEFKKETSSVWETALDTAIAWGPALVKNHYTDLMEVIVQDASDQLYLISNTGKILWKKALPGKILSEVQQVDILKNGKLQMLFNTHHAIHLLDRNGETVTGFPIVLEAESSSPVTVLDYENNRKYRFLIGTEDGKLRNYNGQGKPVEGWEFVPLNGDEVLGRQVHFTIGNKDYITCFTKKGEVFFLERSGKIRQTSNSITTGYEGGPYEVLKGKSITDTRIRYCSGEIAIRELQVGGGDRELQKGLHAAQPWSDKAWLAMKGNELLILDQQEGSTSWESEMDSTNMQGVSGHIILWDPLMNSVVLLDEHLKLRNGFPLMGSGPGVMKDVNGDGSMDLILRDGTSSLTMYSLEQ